MVFKVLYKDMGVQRRLNLVEQEVRNAMKAFDVDNNGVLDLGEFVVMYATADDFKLGQTPKDANMRRIVADAGRVLIKQSEIRFAATEIQAGIQGSKVRKEIAAGARVSV